MAQFENDAVGMIGIEIRTKPQILTVLHQTQLNRERCDYCPESRRIAVCALMYSHHTPT